MLLANLRLLDGIYAVYGANLLIPIYVPYVMAGGLSVPDVFLLQGIFAATLFLTEIPTGYLSDRWGRRGTTILGSALRFAGMLLYFNGSGFWTFAAAEVVSGIGVSCHSGTLDALTYETLTEGKREGEYRRVCGHQRSLFFGAEALGSVLAGLLAVFTLRGPVAACLLLTGGGLVLSLLLMEPARHAVREEKNVRDLLRICSKSVIHDGRLRGIIALFSVIATMGLALFWFTQPYQGMIGLPLAFYGLAHAVIVLAGAIASRYAHALDRILSDQLTLLLLAILMAGSAVGLGFVSSIWGLGFFLLTRVAWALVVPVSNDIVNRLTSSGERATVLSLKAFGQRALFTLVFPLLSILTTALTLGQAILLTGVTGGILAGITLFLMRRTWERIPQPA